MANNSFYMECIGNAAAESELGAEASHCLPCTSFTSHSGKFVDEQSQMRVLESIHLLNTCTGKM